MTPLPVIAIDGNAASGKGALARNLAYKLGFAHMDAGVLYRMVAVRMLENGCAAEDEGSAVDFARLMRRTFDHRHITEAKLKTDEVSQMTSKTSAFPAVRAEILELQREFINSPPDLPSGATAKGTVLAEMRERDATDATQQTIKRAPGFISASIPRATTAPRLSITHNGRAARTSRQMTLHPDAIPHMKAPAAMARFDPILCEVADSIGITE